MRTESHRQLGCPGCALAATEAAERQILISEEQE
jgi:hypothetical protein